MRYLLAWVALLLLAPFALWGCETATLGDDDDNADDDAADDDDNADDDDDDADDDAADDDDDALYGPDNEWWHCFVDDLPQGLSGTGYSTGDTAYNFTLTDQNGDQVELYQFYGKPIFLDLFTMW